LKRSPQQLRNIQSKNTARSELEKFLMIIRRDVFDYTEWQRNLWKDKTVKEIFEKGRSMENK
jgi:hypothetical protein